VFDTISGLTRGHASFLSIGLLGTLWAASAGLMSLMGSLDIAYDVPETRSFVRQVATCMAMVIVIALFFLGAFGLLTLGDWADRWVQMRFHLDGIFLVFWTIGRQITSLALLWMGLSLLDHVLPNIQRSWSALMPGTLLVVVLIGPITLGMNFYVRHVASYDKTYGTLAGLAILMVWIYLISLMTLVGAEVNCEIWKLRTARQGQPRNNRADDSTHFRSAAA
jgi:membrane protein